ncbi:MAG: heavy metal translocating P-type ATPase, partial [Lachnospiraceae bacterium]|nr:heavy metal translocating P-type ATPase [Lachnospiraceae bacterium]
MKKQKFSVTGMTCSACSSHVEKSVRKLSGMEQVTVNLLTNSMQVVYDDTFCKEDTIIEAVEKAGYGASLAGNDEKSAKNRNDQDLSRSGQGTTGQDTAGREALKGKAANKEMKSRLIISIVFMVLLMGVSMHHMFFMWLHLPVPEFLMRLFHGNENALTFAFTQLLLTLPILYVNRKYYQTGFKTLFHLSPNMDSLIAIGSGAALVYGVFAIYRIGYGLGHGDQALVSRYASDLYFESAGMILALITVGKYMETRSKGKTSEAIQKLMDLSPKTAILLSEDGEEREVPTWQ